MNKLMLGNEAFARGLYEGGCQLISSYPGTPSTEITEFGAKYEEMYNAAALQIDEIAERILQLGGTPESKFSEYLKVSTIKELDKTECSGEAIEYIMGYFKNLIAQERALIELAGEANDDVTADLMTGYIAAQEKTVWMLLAFAEHHHKNECGCESK